MILTTSFGYVQEKKKREKIQVAILQFQVWLHNFLDFDVYLFGLRDASTELFILLCSVLIYQQQKFITMTQSKKKRKEKKTSKFNLFDLFV